MEGQTRIFGYEPEEMIGQSITRVIPPELLDEEREILAKLRRGERIDHFDTVRVTKDGRRINISLTVSPLHDRAGNVIGASKIARDITERKQAQELQELLFEELNHRVKNTIATIAAIASQSLRRAASPSDFVSSFNGRIQALARAHDLLVQEKMKGASITEIVREQVLFGAPTDGRISSSGPSLMLDARVAVHLALVLHELATNARKYGALSIPGGQLSISWSLQTQAGRELLLDWKETGVPKVSAPTAHGFGTTLIERTIEGNGGEATIRYDVGGNHLRDQIAAAGDGPAKLWPRNSPCARCAQHHGGDAGRTIRPSREAHIGHRGRSACRHGDRGRIDCGRLQGRRPRRKRREREEAHRRNGMRCRPCRCKSRGRAGRRNRSRIDADGGSVRICDRLRPEGVATGIPGGTCFDQAFRSEAVARGSRRVTRQERARFAHCSSFAPREGLELRASTTHDDGAKCRSD